VLLDELGVDPGPELRQLEMMILRHDPQLTPAGSETHRAGFDTNLSHPVGAFVRRVHEVDELAQLVERSRLVSVVAPGGAGRTRTTLEVVRRWVERSDGWFVDLAPLTRNGSVVDAAAAAVGCDTGDGRPGPARTLDRLAGQPARRPALMVVDNCEHVIQHAAFVVYRKVQQARDRQDNEQWHLFILEDMLDHSGRELGRFHYRFLPQVIAFFYYQVSWLMFVLRHEWSYALNADFDDHAEHEYMAYVAEHPDLEAVACSCSVADVYGCHESFADVLRQIALDERDHKVESIEELGILSRERSERASSTRRPGR
jgi:hypothetical protein